MSKDKKFSSFKDQQMLTENWRKHLSEVETSDILKIGGGMLAGAASKAALDWWMSDPPVRPLKIKLANLPERRIITDTQVIKSAKDFEDLIDLWTGEDEFKEGMRIVRSLNNKFVIDEDTIAPVPAINIFSKFLVDQFDGHDNIYTLIEDDAAFGDFSRYKRMQQLVATYGAQNWEEQEAAEKAKEAEGSGESEKAKSKSSKSKSSKANRTIEAYRDMGDMLASKGHSVPKGHRGRLKYINTMLRDAGKSFKNGDWKDYAGMKKVLASIATTSPGVEDEPVSPRDSDEELKKRIAAKKAADRQKKLDNWKVPPRRAVPPIDPKRAAQISGDGNSVGLREMIANSLKSHEGFKHLFEDSVESKVVSTVVENLMKHEYFRDLAKKKEPEPKSSKIRRTIEAYRDMGDMLASKGHSVPKGHRGRLKYINTMLRDAGKSFKNGDWKDYAGMKKVLASIAGGTPNQAEEEYRAYERELVLVEPWMGSDLGKPKGNK